MGEQRRDFDTPGGTNGQQDQSEPLPPQDGQPRAVEPDDTQGYEPFGEEDESLPDETQQIVAPSAEPDETRPYTPVGRPDETQAYTPTPGRPDETSVWPPAGEVWSGRAEVNPPQQPSLRDSAPYTERMEPAGKPRPWWTPVLLGLLALGLLGALILIAWWMGRDDNPAPVESPTPPPASVVLPTAPTAPPTQAPTATATAAQVVQLPRLVGLPLDDAVNLLNQLGLAYRFEYRESDRPEGTVIEARPDEGAIVPVPSTVVLVVSTGREPSPTPSPTPTGSYAPAPNN